MSDEPSMNDSAYNEWLLSRRAVEPSADLARRVMETVEQRRVPGRKSIHLTDRINASMVSRCAVCAAALMVGVFPFVFVAYVAKLIAF